MAIRRWCSRLLLCAWAATLAACGHSPAAPDGTGIVFNVSAPEIVIGDTLQLTAKVNDANGNPTPNVTFTWTSLNPSIATVSADGVVTAVGMGDTNIQVDATVPAVAQLLSSGNWLASVWALFEAPVHAAGPRQVTKSVPVHSVPKVVITPADHTIGVGATQQFTVIATNKAGVPLALLPTTKWSSSNTAVATIGTSSGLATSKAKGSTTITVSVDTSTAWFAKGTTTLTVSDQCDGVVSVPTINGGLNYLYERDGTYGTAKIHSKFNASGLTATLNRDANSDSGFVQWRGPVSGSASQVETMAYPTGDPYKLNSTGGAFTHSEMIVRVDLQQCTFRIVATLAYHVTRSDQENPGDAGVDIVKGDSNLHKRNDAGSYFDNNAVDPGYPARTNPPFTDMKADAFVVSGFAGYIEDLGLAQVAFTLSATGTNDRPQARKEPPLNLFGLIGQPSSR